MNLFVEELKEINEADLLTLESLMNQLTGRKVMLSPEYIDGIKAENSPVKLYVIRKEGVIIATYSLAVTLIPTGKKGWIEDVVVDESYRGQGLGKTLLLHALAIAPQLSLSKLFLTSRPERITANQLYQRIGFTQRTTNVYEYPILG